MPINKTINMCKIRSDLFSFIILKLGVRKKLKNQLNLENRKKYNWKNQTMKKTD
jgi:hypothetical protein